MNKRELPMKIAITGAGGFMGTHVVWALKERNIDFEIIVQSDSLAQCEEKLKGCTALVHLAGVNRPKEESEFESGNAGYLKKILKALSAFPLPVFLSSSTQALLDNPYGKSKLAAEKELEHYSQEFQAPCAIARLPNVFGKWTRPHYNSAVATFCFNAARNLPLTIHDPSHPLTLLYIDDVVEEILKFIQAPREFCQPGILESSLRDKSHRTTVGELATLIESFKHIRTDFNVPETGAGLTRALYSTFVSFLPEPTYQVPLYKDPRGEFCEWLKFGNAGQVSYFTALPGITRGCHYHHTKTEKFLVLTSTARFRFQHLITKEMMEFEVQGGTGTVVDTLPGWIHDITNLGQETMVVMLWANEVFDKSKPDTFASEISTCLA